VTADIITEAISGHSSASEVCSVGWMWLMADPPKKEEEKLSLACRDISNKTKYHTVGYKIRTGRQGSPPSFGDKFDREFD